MVGFICKVWTARNELLSDLKPANCWLHGLYNRRMVVRFCILLFRFIHVCLPVVKKCYRLVRFFPAQEVYGKGAEQAEQYNQSYQGLSYQRKFGLVGVFILREWCGYKGRWSDCSIFSLIGSLWQTQNIRDLWTEQSWTYRWANRSIMIIIKFATWRHTRMTDTHICNLCPLRHMGK